MHTMHGPSEVLQMQVCFDLALACRSCDTPAVCCAELDNQNRLDQGSRGLLCHHIVPCFMTRTCKACSMESICLDCVRTLLERLD